MFDRQEEKFIRKTIRYVRNRCKSNAKLGLKYLGTDVALVKLHIHDLSLETVYWENVSDSVREKIAEHLESQGYRVRFGYTKLEEFIINVEWD